MNQQEFEEIVNETVAEIKNLLAVKGGEYARSDDRLANFKRGAADTGATPLQVAFIYASKHIDSIITYIRDDAIGAKRDRSEPIEGRLNDLINYCIFIKALIKDQEREEAKELLG